MKEYDLINPYPDLISSISIREFRKNQYMLSICLQEKDIELHYSNINYINLENDVIIHFNTRIDHELLDKINKGSYRRFETRDGRLFSVVFIPTLYFMTPKMIKKVKEKALTNPVFKSFLV